MVRLDDLHEEEAHHMRNMAGRFAQLELPPDAWVTSPPLRDATVALVTSAGLHRRGDPPFRWGDYAYRLIPRDVDPAELVQAHVSVNFDRTHYQRDVNVVLPLDRIRELADAGEIGGVSEWHFSVMGANPTPTRLAPAAADMAQRMHDLGVDAAMLAPV